MVNTKFFNNMPFYPNIPFVLNLGPVGLVGGAVVGGVAAAWAIKQRRRRKLIVDE
jgi:hypothetical protein